MGALPRSFEECVRGGGAVEPEARGGRCYARFAKSDDLSAYLHCRDAGGVGGAAGPAAGRAEGESHVCTLVFPSDE